jgi:antirestriction protein ArdC
MLEDAKSGKPVNYIKPWSPRGVLHANALRPTRPYSLGANQLLCMLYCQANGWKSRFWITPAAVKRRGGQIRPDQNPVFVYKVFPFVIEIPFQESSIQTEPKWRTAGLAASHFEFHYAYQEVPVFNIEQTTLLKLVKKRRVLKLDPTSESIVTNMPNRPVIMNRDINATYYDQQLDKVNLPLKEQFKSKAHYYDALFHELAHSTGHSRRLSRPTLLNSRQFGDHEYSAEELIAELASAFLSNRCGLSCDRVISNNAIYLQHWLDQLNGWRHRNPANLAIYIAMAQQAANYILGLESPKPPRPQYNQEPENAFEVSLMKDIALA